MMGLTAANHTHKMSLNIANSTVERGESNATTEIILGSLG
jgi:hypothetical protein